MTTTTPEKMLKTAAQAIAMGNTRKGWTLMDAALTSDPDMPAQWQAECLAMRATAASELGNKPAATADYREALRLYDTLEEPDPLFLIHLVGLLAQELAWEQPDAAYALYLREYELVNAHQAAVLRHPERRLAWVMAPLGVGLVEEHRERFAEARQWYLEAKGRCAAARIKPTQRMAQMIDEGLARLPS